MSHSKVLRAVAERDERITSYEYDPSNDMGVHWLHLVYPYVVRGDGGSVHESTVKDCLDVLRTEVVLGIDT